MHYILELNIFENHKLGKFCLHKTRGTVLRSWARWYEGERSTRYFYNLEKRNHAKKSITKLKLSDGSILNKQLDILEEDKRFYKTLYSSKQVENFESFGDTFLNRDNISPLSDNQRALCKDNITEKEAFDALKELKAGKSPGTDGLPA